MTTTILSMDHQVILLDRWCLLVNRANSVGTKMSDPMATLASFMATVMLLLSLGMFRRIRRCLLPLK